MNTNQMELVIFQEYLKLFLILKGETLDTKDILFLLLIIIFLKKRTRRISLRQLIFIFYLSKLNYVSVL